MHQNKHTLQGRQTHACPYCHTKDKEKKILWIHGGGYMTGMKEMVYMSRAIDLVKNYGATILSPGYRLSFIKPYPTAIEDCYDVLLYLKNHADELEINRNQIMAGGESAGGFGV